MEVERPTSADYFASGGYAYIEEIERKMVGNTIETTARVKYMAANIGHAGTGWIDLCDTDYRPVRVATSAITTATNDPWCSTVDTNTATSGWVVRWFHANHAGAVSVDGWRSQGWLSRLLQQL